MLGETVLHDRQSRLLLSLGVPLPAVTKRLGHATPAVSAASYRAALSGDDLAAAVAWGRTMCKAARRNAT